MPSRVSEGGNGAESEDALGLRVALRLCRLAAYMDIVQPYLSRSEVRSTRMRN